MGRVVIVPRAELLAGYKDKRAEPAYKKAFLDFAKAPKGGKDDQDIKWAAIAAGDFHNMALRTDGTVWSWGYNGAGQLGDGTGLDRPDASAERNAVPHATVTATRVPGRRSGMASNANASGNRDANRAALADPSSRGTRNPVKAA